ncbi:hypothetical protein [Amycolatopsis sp. NPDC049868]|uniref:hypothetical protein n=1 Tax=Amycolatopsis sp. NPDC049868 TaxID=3363934 RepID=UPI0037A69DAD
MDRTPGDRLAEVSRLEAELATRPDDIEVKDRLAGELVALTVDVRSLTRDRTPVFTSTRQREFCMYAAGRLIELGVGGEAVQTSARTLQAELRAGEEWMWRNRHLSLALMVVIVVAGLAIVVMGALSGSLSVVVVAGVLGSVGLAAVVFARRKQRWQIDAERVTPVIWRHGI